MHEGEIMVRAFDPVTSKGLLINGEESYSVMPSREKKNPDALEITSKGTSNHIKNSRGYAIWFCGYHVKYTN